MQPCLPIIKGSRDRSLLQPCFGEAFTKQDALADPALATLLARVVESQLNVSGGTVLCVSCWVGVAVVCAVPSCYVVCVWGGEGGG